MKECSIPDLLLADSMDSSFWLKKAAVWCPCDGNAEQFGPQESLAQTENTMQGPVKLFGNKSLYFTTN